MAGGGYATSPHGRLRGDGQPRAPRYPQSDSRHHFPDHRQPSDTRRGRQHYDDGLFIPPTAPASWLRRDNQRRRLGYPEPDLRAPKAPRSLSNLPDASSRGSYDSRSLYHRDPTRTGNKRSREQSPSDQDRHVRPRHTVPGASQPQETVVPTSFSELPDAPQPSQRATSLGIANLATTARPQSGEQAQRLWRCPYYEADVERGRYGEGRRHVVRRQVSESRTTAQPITQSGQTLLNVLDQLSNIRGGLKQEDIDGAVAAKVASMSNREARRIFGIQNALSAQGTLSVLSQFYPGLDTLDRFISSDEPQERLVLRERIEVAASIRNKPCPATASKNCDNCQDTC